MFWKIFLCEIDWFSWRHDDDDDDLNVETYEIDSYKYDFDLVIWNSLNKNQDDDEFVEEYNEKKINGSNFEKNKCLFEVLVLISCFWLFIFEFLFRLFCFFLSFWNKMNKWMFDQISNTCISFCIYIWLNKKIKKKKNDFFPLNIIIINDENFLRMLLESNWNQWNVYHDDVRHMFTFDFFQKKKNLILFDFVVIIEWEKDKLKGRMNEMRKKNMECKCHL